MMCPKCNESIPEISRYCLHCGVFLNPAERQEEDGDDTDDIDWANRVLCSDGTCTGAIVDGRCSVCGKSADDLEER